MINETPSIPESFRYSLICQFCDQVIDSQRLRIYQGHVPAVKFYVRPSRFLADAQYLGDVFHSMNAVRQEYGNGYDRGNACSFETIKTFLHGWSIHIHKTYANYCVLVFLSYKLRNPVNYFFIVGMPASMSECKYSNFFCHKNPHLIMIIESFYW